jgi:hypothetical protein
LHERFDAILDEPLPKGGSTSSMRSTSETANNLNGGRAMIGAIAHKFLQDERSSLRSR